MPDELEVISREHQRILDGIEERYEKSGQTPLDERLRRLYRHYVNLTWGKNGSAQEIKSDERSEAEKK